MREGMRLGEFRELVRRQFGDDLHGATPAGVRDFLDLLQEDAHIAETVSRVVYPDDGRLDIYESAKSYEEIMRTFFAQMLKKDSEEAVPLLWTVALEMAYNLIESQDAERIGHLFKGMEEPPFP